MFYYDFIRFDLPVKYIITKSKAFFSTESVTISSKTDLNRLKKDLPQLISLSIGYQSFYQTTSASITSKDKSK